MFRIGEFANFIKIPIKTLRYYDEIDIFKPIMVDEETGYRYYSAGQLPLLNKILFLKDIGFSLNQISYVIKNDLPTKELIDLLALKDMESSENIRKEEDRRRRINSFIKFLNEENSNMNYDVIVKDIKPFMAACLRDTVPSYSEQGVLWGEIAEHIEKNNSKILPGCMVIYYDSGYKENHVDLEVIELISNPIPNTDRIKYMEVTGATVASIIHKGSYNSIGASYNAVFKWIEDNGYVPSGPNREIYIEGEWSVKTLDDYITEIQIPLKRV